MGEHPPSPPAPTEPPTADDAGPPRHHHPVVRVTHWVNTVAVLLMAASGLRIFNAYPAFARRGEGFCCWPAGRTGVPHALTFGGWLAGARHWHFAVMWVLVVNGLVYLAFLWLHGEWRTLVPRRGDARDAWEMLRFYLFVRKHHPRQGKYNALQKGAYFAMPIVGAVLVLTGLAIWKPVQLAPLTALFGGYVWARYWHFLAMLALVLLTLGHVFMVLTVDPYALRAMTTGGYSARLSPEARDARPFYHLLPRRERPAPRPAEAAAPEPSPVPEPPPAPAPAAADDREGGDGPAAGPEGAP